MTKRNATGHPVLIIGAGRGGNALLEMFLEDELVRVLGVVDINPEAIGILLAKKHGVPTYANVAEALLACKSYPDCLVYNLTHDGSVAEAVGKIFGDKRVASGPEVELFWRMVTNLRRTKSDLERSQSQLQAIIHNVMDGIITINESGQILGFNPAAEKIFGYSQQDILGKHVKVLVPESIRRRYEASLGRYVQTRRGRSVTVHRREVTAIRKNGERFLLELSASEMALTGQRFFIGIVRDITERKQAEEKIAHLAHHDYLTGLPNRALFLDRLERAIALAKRGRYGVAVLFLDLDGFKRVNDTLGHAAGDLLLREVARKLKGSVRKSDTVARVGGDEFTFVLSNIGTNENVSAAVKKIIAVLSEPVDLVGQQCQVGASVGISIYPDDSEDFEMLLKRADDAMYLAKQSGKNTYRFYG